MAVLLQQEAEERAKLLMMDKEALASELSTVREELSSLVASREEEREAAERRFLVYEDEVLRLRDRMEASLSSLSLAEKQNEALQVQSSDSRAEAVGSMRRVIELEKELETTKASLAAAGSGLGGAGVVMSRLFQQIGQPIPSKVRVEEREREEEVGG